MINLEDYVTLTSCSSRFTRLVLSAALLLTFAGSAAAQSKPVTFTGGVDFPTVYFFRGIRQEADPKLTTFVFGDVGFSLLSDGTGGVKTAGINVGTWNAFMTGSSGSDGPEDSAFYESDVYAGLTLGFQNGVSLTPMFTAYTSPNDMFTTVKEISFKVAHASKAAPYALVAFELGGDDDGEADGGHLSSDGGKGTYLELGVGPSWPLAEGKATVAIPVKVGLSLKDYYELDGVDNKFGYIDAGVLITVPFASKWNVHGGVNVLGFGDTLKAFNNGDGGQVIASIGIGLSY